MNKIRVIAYKCTPYLASIIVGIIFFYIANKVTGNVSSLFINISAAFVAIPLIFLFYELTQKQSKKKLNKDIYDFVKLQVDREIMSSLNQLGKLLFEYTEYSFSFESINKILSYSKEDLISKIANNKYLGFQVYKKWEITEDNIKQLLNSSLLLSSIEDVQVSSMIKLVSYIESIGEIHKNDNMFIALETKNEDYFISAGDELNVNNDKFTERYILLRKLGKNRGVVIDFGDFNVKRKDRLLDSYKINPEHVELLANLIWPLLTEINTWLSLTGHEFIIDTKVFRIFHNKSKSKDAVT